MRAFLLSIKPKYRRAILGGKKFELRRLVGPRVERGDPIVPYFSSPVKAVMGAFVAGEVYVGTRRELDRC